MSVRAVPSMVPVVLAASRAVMSVASSAPAESVELKLIGLKAPRMTRAASISAVEPLISVRANPPMNPVPLAPSMREMSAASAAPLRSELKLGGGTSRSAMAWTTASAVPLISVRAEPSMVPVPLTASRAVMSVAFSAPAESVELKLVGSESRSARAWLISAMVPSMPVRAEPSIVPVPFAAWRAEMSVAFSAPAESVELKLVGSESRSARAWLISAIVPLMPVRAEPSTVPVPLATWRSEMSVAFSAPAESVELKLMGSESRSARAWLISAMVPLMLVRAKPSMVPVPLAAWRAEMSVAFSAPAESVELKLVGSESRSTRAWLISAMVPLIPVRAEPSTVPVPFNTWREVMSVASTEPVRIELKLTGSESRSIRAWVISACVPLILVRLEPLIVPTPLKPSIELISVALASPVKVLKKLVGFALRLLYAWTTSAAVPSIAVAAVPSTVPPKEMMSRMFTASAEPSVRVVVNVAGADDNAS